MKDSMRFSIEINRAPTTLAIAVGFSHGRFGLVLGPLAIHAGFRRDPWS